MNFSTVDVDWAWSSFEPRDDAPWDIRAAAHLYRRAGFGASQTDIAHAASQAPSDTVERLVNASEPESFRVDMRGLEAAALANGSIQQLSAQWVYRMLHTPAPLLEKMTLFWHGHFATSAEKVDDVELMLEQNGLLRTHALGDFSELLLQISKNPAMLLYLDSATNRKSHPNENYAREIMELFALGEGNYREEDIRELARCFTGWEVKRKRFRFNRYQHDSGIKTVLGKTGPLGGEDGVAVVASQDATARFLVQKLIRYFFVDQEEIPNDLVEPLARQLRENDLLIRPTVARILGSNLFFSPVVRGRKIRSPVELGIALLLALDGTTDCFRLARSFESLGQGLYLPPSVKGWDGGRSWINSSTLLGRANLVHRLLDGGKTRFDGASISEWAKHQGLTTAGALISYLEPLLFAVALSSSRKDSIQELVDRFGDQENWAEKTIYTLCTLPEFQLA